MAHAVREAEKATRKQRIGETGGVSCTQGSSDRSETGRQFTMRRERQTQVVDLLLLFCFVLSGHPWKLPQMRQRDLS